MQLYGAMAYRDCTKAVLATDRECMADACCGSGKQIGNRDSLS